MKIEGEILPLTGLRFIAAFYVFIFHIEIRWPIFANTFLHNLFMQGAVGMSFFFMLSGFILCLRYSDLKTPIGKYYSNRIARIYPVYLVAAILTLPWIGLSFGTGSPSEIVNGIIAGAILIFSDLTLTQAWLPQLIPFWNNGGSWSISVEMFCYLILPFILPKIVAFKKRNLLILIAVSYVAASIPGITLSYFTPPGNGIFYYMPIYRLFEFLIGLCILLLFKLHSPGKLHSIGQMAAVLLMVLYLGFFGPSRPLYIGHNFIILPLLAYLIYSLANGRGILGAVLAHPIAVWLGKISYSFYSFQVLLILVLSSNHDKIVSIFPLLADNNYLALAAIMVLLIFSVLGFYLIEEPCRKWIRNRQFLVKKTV